MVDSKNIYDFIRNLAVNKLQCDIFRKLHIIYNSQSCMQRHAEIPNKLYSWTLDDYLQRRKIDNYIWLDVLKKDIPEDCLQILKLQDDLVEMLKLFKTIFLGFTGEFVTSDFIVNDIIQPIRQAHKFLNVLEDTVENCEHNRTVLNAYIQQKTTYNIVKRDSKQELIKLDLENKLVNNDVWFPIEIRYQLRYHQSNVHQIIHKFETDEDKLNNDLKVCLKNHQVESYCSQCVLNMYYAQIENYKNRIAQFKTLYDKEDEKIDNLISYKKLSLEKLREQRKFLKEQLNRFYEELKQIEQMEINAREAAERRHQQELEEMQARAAMKTKKGKKKDKKK